MLKSIRLAGGLLAFAMIALVLSCSDDKSNIGGGGSVPVADGFYVTKVGITPVSSSQLVAEKVEADAFGVQDRSGFLANYIYLTAGSYNIVSVIDQEIAKTLGGAAVTAGDPVPANTESSDCELHAYTLVEEFAEAGDAIVIATEGLYKVMMDNETKEFVFYRITKGQIIGAASAAGWSNSVDQEMAITGTPTAAGAVMSVAGLTMRPGEYKLRFNCRWKIDRRIDPTASPGHEFANGYAALTNFGGTPAELAPGGSNFVIAAGEDGIYTFTATWTPADGMVFTVTKTAPLDPITFNPSDYAWGITGAATANGWANDDPLDNPIGEDIDLNYNGLSGSTYTWVGTFTLTAGEFKFRTNNSWSYNKGYGDVTIIGPDAGLLTNVGGNFNATQPGSYQFTITTSNEGATWTVSVDKL